MKFKRFSNIIFPILKVFLPLVVVFFLFKQLESEYDTLVHHFLNFSITFYHVSLILILLIFMFVNWILESLKWKYLVEKVTSISFLNSLKSIFNGLAFGLITPFKVGDVVTRVLHIKSENRSKTYGSILVSRSSQLVITLISGITGLCFYSIIFFEFNNYILFFGLIINAAFFYLYFIQKKIIPLLKKIKYISNYIYYIDVIYDYSFRDYLVALIFSLLRYCVFLLQYFIMFKIFNVDILFSNLAICISIVFLIKSTLPLTVLGDIGVREIAAVAVFGYAGFDKSIILLITLSIWFVNIVVPSLIGSFFTKNLTTK